MNEKLKELSARRPWAKKQERKGRGRKQQDRVKFTFNPPTGDSGKAVMSESEKSLRAILSGAHGALADASDIPVPAFDKPIEGAIYQLINQRNAARAVADAARKYAAATAGLDGTAEGAALLAAIREMEKDNDN